MAFMLSYHYDSYREKCCVLEGVSKRIVNARTPRAILKLFLTFKIPLKPK